MTEYNDCAPERKPDFARATAASDAAFALDVEWLRMNPEKTRRIRPVHKKELPRSLRHLHVVRVEIQRAGSQHLVCQWIDRQGRAVLSSFYQHGEPIVQGAPSSTVIFVPQPGGGVQVAVDAGSSAGDRAWFAAHPGETSYTRPLTTEEKLLLAPAGYVCVGGQMQVTQLADGVRNRHPLGMTFEPAGAAQ